MRAAALAATPGKTGEIAYWIDWPRTFDIALWIDFGDPPADLPAPLRLLHAGSFFRLYRIVPP